VSARTAILLAAGGSLALLLGAFAFQYLGGLAPCKMCLWQRWPHAVAVAAGGLSLLLLPAAMAAIGLLSALTTAGIGLYHAGVEQGWWPGPDSCSGDAGGLAGLSGSDLLNPDQAAPIVMCDDIVWSLFGLSMAGWNAVLSLLLAALWFHAFRRLIRAG
jgi:disulfide bond formation protein DsbB